MSGVDGCMGNLQLLVSVELSEEPSPPEAWQRSALTLGRTVGCTYTDRTSQRRACMYSTICMYSIPAANSAPHILLVTRQVIVLVLGNPAAY